MLTKEEWLQKNGANTVSHKFLHKAMDHLTDAVVDAIKRAIDPLIARIAELESEQLKFQGLHSEAKSYRRNDIVQRSGSAWICTTAFAQGEFQHEHWRLLIKKGSA